jgi:Fe-S-cluster containining protein
MDCLACKGACCEDFSLRRQDMDLPSPDVERWLTLHAIPSPAHLRFECRCLQLTLDGRCAIYQDRPDVCRVFAPGGEDCLETVRRRRTPEAYAQIRQAGDPIALPV